MCTEVQLLKTVFSKKYLHIHRRDKALILVIPAAVQILFHEFFFSASWLIHGVLHHICCVW